MIRCRDVSASAGSFQIRNVSFVVPDGGHAVLTGPTASGKSTLLQIIAGGIRPAAGVVSIDGADVTHDAPEFRGVGIVPQHGYLFPYLSVLRNIEYGVRDAVTASELTRRFGIEHLMGRSVATLSGGERQLVALCRALGPRPRVVLLDEPFSALDVQRRIAAVREFHDLQSEWGLTVLHVTHDGADAPFASLRFEMSDGVLMSVALMGG